MTRWILLLTTKKGGKKEIALANGGNCFANVGLPAFSNRGLGKKAYGYIRLSRWRAVNPRKEGRTLAEQSANQQVQISEYYRLKLSPCGFAWGGFFRDDSISNARKKLIGRPAGSELINILGKGDCIVAVSPDRLFTTSRDFKSAIAALKIIGAELHILSIGGITAFSKTGIEGIIPSVRSSRAKEI